MSFHPIIIVTLDHRIESLIILPTGKNVCALTINKLGCRACRLFLIIIYTLSLDIGILTSKVSKIIV